jgi:uncharacterized RDD family membrane protein YckC
MNDINDSKMDSYAGITHVSSTHGDENYIGLLIKTIAYLIDSIIAGLIMTPFFIIVFIIANWGHGFSQVDSYTLTLYLLIILLVVCWLYFAGFESSKFMATPGKMVFRIKVSDMDGNRISFIAATVRFILKLAIPDTLALLIPILSCVSGLYIIGNVLAMYTNARRQCFHDMMSGTVVTGHR